MTDSFPYIVVPPELRKVAGEPLAGTRLYRKDGPDSESHYWCDALMDVFGPMVSPGGVSMYAPVSRAAVHRRIRDGKLTAFFFYVTTPKRNWFGTTTIKRELHFGLIPVSECRAWGKELEERAIRERRITREQLEGEKPDWDGWFLEWNSKYARARLRKERK